MWSSFICQFLGTSNVVFLNRTLARIAGMGPKKGWLTVPTKFAIGTVPPYDSLNELLPFGIPGFEAI